MTDTTRRKALIILAAAFVFATAHTIIYCRVIPPETRMYRIAFLYMFIHLAVALPPALLGRYRLAVCSLLGSLIGLNRLYQNFERFAFQPLRPLNPDIAIPLLAWGVGIILEVMNYKLRSVSQGNVPNKTDNEP